MADSSVPVTGGSGYNVDTRTNAGGDHRQVIVVGDPSVTDNVVSAVTADPGPSSTTSGLVMRLAGSASVQIVGATSSLGVYFDRGNPSVNIGTPTVASITNTVGVYFDRGNPSVNVGTPTVASITNTVGVYFDRANPSVSISNSPTVVTSNISGMSQTASIFTTSGTYTGNGLSGLTLVAPSANYSFKVFAFSLTTTAQTNSFARFTNGASSSPTEYWRVALWAPAQGVTGANLAVTPPGHLWATGTSTTLSLVIDNVTLVHYSVSYIKETA